LDVQLTTKSSLPNTTALIRVYCFIQGGDVENMFSEDSYMSGREQDLSATSDAINPGVSSSPRNSGKVSPPATVTTVGIIAENALLRTALTRSVESLATEFAVSAYETVEQWGQDPAHSSARIVLLCATGQKATEAVIHQGLNAIREAGADQRVIIISDIEHPSMMIAALEGGAKGYVPMSLDLEIAIGAIKLVNVGGTFMPASGLLLSRSTHQVQAEVTGNDRAADVFTQRQLTVLESLRQGTPNKLIAYKLNMSEGTVKVHVRNMMRRLQARNRTELVCRTNALFAA
jgi:DNA-binding NarL/FixJ family response regulator